eukprot:Filipodium_phascolosomae@DN8636_c0_g1_i1.p1
MTHGIGRSGDICEPQPKAVGSSVINTLTSDLVLEALKIAGCEKAAKAAVVLPVATGMAIMLTLLCLKRLLTPNATADKVIFSRIDQKSAFKAICCAGMRPIVVELIRKGDTLHTDLLA